MLALVGVLLTVAAGAHGWTLIQTHHVGVAGGAAPGPAGGSAAVERPGSRPAGTAR